jgi:hypothetical protein
VNDEPINPLAAGPGSKVFSIVCLACPSHNAAMQMTGIHPAVGGMYVHLVCSHGHRQRLGVRSVDGGVVIQLDPADQSMPARLGETAH